MTSITETVGANSRAASVTISSNQLTSLTLPDPDTTGPLAAPVWDFGYSGTSGLLTKTTDPVGSITVITYGTGAGAETVSSLKQGADTSYLTPFTTNGVGGTQASPGALKRVTDSFGQFTDERGKNMSLRVDENGFITEIKDHNNVSWKYERNAEGLISKITTPDPDGPDPLLALETTYEYDPLDPRGNVFRETKRALGSTTILAQQTWEYANPDYSLPTKHVDELGRVTKYTIGAKTDVANKRGKILAMTEIVGVEDTTSNGFTDDAKTKYTYFTVAGHVGMLSTVTDPLGRVTKYDYWTTDPHEGLLKKVTRNYGAQLTTNVQFEYDNFRNRKTVIDELGRRTETEYDKLDRPIKRTDADPDGTGTQYTSPITQVAYDAAGNPIKTTDPLGNVTRSIYDKRNRLIYEIAPRPDNTAAYTRTIDDEDIGFFMTAGWTDWVTSAAYNGDYRYHDPASGSPNYAQWEFGGLDTGKNYEIFITWPVFGGNATDAPHEVLDVNNTVLKTVALDENYAPNDEIVGNVAWERLGVFSGSTGYKVKVKPSSTGYVGADAVRIVEVGPTVKYEYDPAGNLLTSTDALGNTTSYGYDDVSRRTSVTLADPDGAAGPLVAPVYQTQYYSNGLVKKEIDPFSKETVYEPDALGRTVKITYPDPDGAQTAPSSPITKYQFDAAGRLTYVTQTDVDATLTRTTRYFYDGLGYQNAVAQPLPAGTPQEIKVDDPAPPTNWTLDSSNGYQGDHLWRDPGSSSEYAEWSFSSLDTTKTYAVYSTWVVKNDANNLPLNATNARYEVREGTTPKATFLVNQKLPPADETTDVNIQWSRLGLYKPGSTSLTVRLYADADGKLVADGLRLVELGPVSKTVTNKVGNPVASIDALGSETITRYDDLDRLTGVYEPLRDPTVTPYRPTPTDNNPNTYGWSSVTDARAYGGNYLRSVQSDAADSYMAVNLPANPQSKTFAVMATWVSDPNNISAASFRVEDVNGNTVATVSVDQTRDPGDYQDETGRWWKVLGTVTNLPPTYTTVWVAGTPGAQADAVRIVEVGPTAFTNTYDLAGNLTQVTDAKNNDTWLYYDNLNRVKEEKNELLKSSYFEYYDDSRVKKVTDRNGRIIEHYYDNLGRETEERWKSGASTVRSLTFGYDANSQLRSADDDGTNARDYDWFYDNIGRLKESEFLAQGSLWEFINKYDDASRRERRDVLRGGATQFSDTFVWDNASRLKSLQRDAIAWGHDLRADFTYNAAGQFDQIKRYSDTAGTSLIVTSHYGYDGIGRLTSLDHKNSAGASITGYAWQYEANHQLKTMDFTNVNYNAEDATFGYDRTNQLLSGDRANAGDDEAYAYDGAGNRTSANGATYVTNANNRLTDDGTFTYTYDDEGNRLTRVRKSSDPADDKTVEYTWDYRNRLEKVTFKRNDGTITKTVDLRYDMFNQLTQRVVDPDGALGIAPLQTDDYLWESGELVGVYGYNSLVFAYGPAPDMVLFESATALHALLGDHLNTVRDVISMSGAMENHLVYNSYGELKSQTGGGAYSPFHRFTGKPFDVAVGLQYNVNRWYDPATGRWTSEDPIGFAGGDANLNRYGGNSPTNSIDPFGTLEVGRKQLKAFVARQIAKIPQSEFVLITDERTKYTGSTSAELYDAIQQVEKDNETVDELIIKSHGNDEGMWDDDENPFLSADPDLGRVFVTDDKGRMRDVLDTLKNITNTETHICLRGCVSQPQAEDLFDLIGNGAEVTGNTEVSSGIPWTTIDLPWGPRHTYTDRPPWQTFIPSQYLDENGNVKPLPGTAF